jgi:AP-3 complex subunit mu
MIQSLFVLNCTGEVIIEKHWRGMRGRDATLTFWNAVLAALRVPSDVPPFLPAGGNVLVHLHRSGLFFLASVGPDTPPLVATDFLATLADTLLAYFGELNEHAIKDNFITVYELLDEMLDEGYPMTVEQNILKALVPPPTVLGKVITTVTGDSNTGATRKQFPTASPATPWRRNGVKHAQNEIFVDIVETVDAIYSAPAASGRRGVAPAVGGSYAPRLTHAMIRGEVQVNSRLSGMPDVSMSLRSVAPIHDTALHRCVRRQMFQDSGALSFIPPDGPFTLMSYIVRDRASISIPIELDSNIALSAADSSGTVSIYIKPRFAVPPSPYPASRIFDGGAGSGGSVASSMGTTTGMSSLSHVTNTPPLNIGGVPSSTNSFSSAAQSGGSMMLAQVMAAGGRMAGGAGARKSDMLMEDVEVSIPFGRAVASVSLSANVGTVEFDSSTGMTRWTVGPVARDVTPSMTGTLTLAPGVLGANAMKPSVLATFRIPGLAVSGMFVDRLDLGNSANYKYFKGLRCMTKGERYELRP